MQIIFNFVTLDTYLYVGTYFQIHKKNKPRYEYQCTFIYLLYRMQKECSPNCMGCVC